MPTSIASLQMLSCNNSSLCTATPAPTTKDPKSHKSRPCATSTPHMNKCFQPSLLLHTYNLTNPQKAKQIYPNLIKQPHFSKSRSIIHFPKYSNLQRSHPCLSPRSHYFPNISQLTMPATHPPSRPSSISTRTTTTTKLTKRKTSFDQAGWTVVITLGSFLITLMSIFIVVMVVRTSKNRRERGRMGAGGGVGGGEGERVGVELEDRK